MTRSADLALEHFHRHRIPCDQPVVEAEIILGPDLVVACHRVVNRVMQAAACHATIDAPQQSLHLHGEDVNRFRKEKGDRQ